MFIADWKVSCVVKGEPGIRPASIRIHVTAYVYPSKLQQLSV